MAFRWNRNGVRVLLLVLLLAGAAVGVRRWLGDSLEPRTALEVLRSVQERMWAAPAFVAGYVLLTSAFVPATLLHMIAGAAWGFQTGLLLSLLAFHLTSNLQFLVARRLGRGLVEQKAGGLRMVRLEAFLAREGLRAAMLVRLLPIPNLAVNLAAGVSGIRWRDFALGTFVGTLPVISVYTYFAAALVEGAAGAERDALVHTAIGGALVVLLVVVTRVLAGRRGRAAL